jgi:hypothetical protein
MIPDYKAFSIAMLADFPESMPDEFDMQELAVKHGLLIAHQVTGPCSENCWCQSYCSDLSKGETCYRRHEEMKS